jgi:hypothetical protein
VRSCTNAGKTESVVREWRQSHLDATASQAAATGVSTGTGNTALVPAPAQQQPSPQGGCGRSKQSGERPAHNEGPSDTEDDGDSGSSGGSSGGGGGKPHCKLWRCTSRVRSGGRKKNTHRCHAWNPISRLRCKQCHAMNPDLQASREREESDEITTGASSAEAQFESSGGSSGDSAALVEATDDVRRRAPRTCATRYSQWATGCAHGASQLPA